MTDDMIPVPRALIERAVVALGEWEYGGALWEDLRALLDPPKPPAPRLRVVDLDVLYAMFVVPARPTARIAAYDDIEAQPDVLVVIERVVRSMTLDDRQDAQIVMARITAALTKGGTQ